MNPENQVNIAPQRNQKRALGMSRGMTFPFDTASSSFMNCTLTRLKK